MELDLETKQLLADLIAKPEMVSQSHADMLNNLAQKYPYYQPIHLLIAKASVNENNASELIAMGALYNGGDLLYTVIHHPENLFIENRIIYTANEVVAIDDNEIVVENYENDIIEENEQELVQIDNDESEVFEEIAEVDNFTSEKQPTQLSDEQETYEEIVEVDVLDIPLQLVSADDEVKEEIIEEKDFVFENIVNTDFFAFEENFSTEKQAEPTSEEITVAHPEEYSQEAEAQTISNYNDDKLPYTFLWWLAKTRKEHEQIFQPYVTQKQTVATQSGDLQQQYVEHIFHLQSPFNEKEEKSKGPLNRQILARGTEIIDSFIKNDPQIKAPKAEQINTENKAKKSAEDHNDLVSETLAAIYIEQMLYHKAIETYEKLSLKFPEKSRYFADLIQSLEKKI